MARAALIALVCVTAWLYRPVLNAPYVYEDVHYVTGQAHWAVPSRAVTQWTFTRDLPAAPRLDHGVNLGLHLANGVLLAGVTSLVAAPWVAVGAAGVFLLHPLTSAATAYVAGRADLLVTTFTLLALGMALIAAQWRRVWAVTLGLSVAGVCCLGAAMSKELGAVSPFLVLAALALWRRQTAAWHLAGQAIVLVSALWLGHLGTRVAPWVLDGMPASVGGASVTPARFIWAQLAELAELASLLVRPSGFAIDHDAWALASSWSVAGLVLCGLGIAGLARTWRLRPVVAFGIVVAGAWLLPRVLLPTSEYLTEVQMYPAMAGISLSVAALLAPWVMKETA